MKHVDTLAIQLVLKVSKNTLLKMKQRLTLKETSKYEKFYVGKHPSSLYSFLYICRGCYLIVTVEHDAIKDIESAEVLQEQVIQMIIHYFKISRDDIVETKIERINKRNCRKTLDKQISAVEINRLDYKTDFQMQSNKQADETTKVQFLDENVIEQDENIKEEQHQDVEILEEQLAIQDIFRVAADKSFRYKKQLRKYKNRTNCTYSSDRKGSVVINCYFKEYERLEDEDVEGAKKFKNILRTEIQVNNKHLNYKKNKRSKTLFNYFNNEIAEQYFKKYVHKIFYTETYYRVDVALKLIHANKTLKDFVKQRLCKFLTTINELGFTDAKENYDIATFNKYIKTVRELGINPLTYKDVINGKYISIEKVKNFTRFHNSVDENNILKLGGNKNDI